MTAHYLNHEVTINGQYFRTLFGAAHVVRQHAIDHADLNGWKLSREMREADSAFEATLVKRKLAVWLADSNRI